MISRSWFGRNACEPGENEATAHPPQSQPLTLTRKGTGSEPVSPVSPVSPGRPGSAQPSPAARTAPSGAEMDGMSEQELLDFLERQNAALAGDSKATLSIQRRTSTSPMPAPPAPAAAATATVTADPGSESAATADGNPDHDHLSTAAATLSVDYATHRPLDFAPVGEGRTIPAPPTAADGLVDAAIAEWTEIIANWDDKLRKKTRFVTELAHKGIPASLRGVAWQRATSAAKAARTKTVGSTLLKIGAGAGHDTELQDEYPGLLAQTSAHEKQINRDIARTYSADNMRNHGFNQENLYNVIKAYSNFDTEVGYCQGSPFIVGVLLMHMPEQEAFAAFAILMRDFKLRGLFRPSMADLPLRLFQFDRLFRETHSELHAHFEDMLIPNSSFASQWFLTLFGAVLPLPCVFRLMDVFLLEPAAHGTLTVFRAGLAILGDNHDALLMSNFEGILSLLSKSALEQRYHDRADQLLKEVAKAASSVTAKRLEKYEKEYHKAQLARAKEEGEVEVFRRKNAELEEETRVLRAKVEALDDETKQLAEKLLEKSVLLNETEERLEHTEELLRDRFEADACMNAARKVVRVQIATQTVLSHTSLSHHGRTSPTPRPDGGGEDCDSLDEDAGLYPITHLGLGVGLSGATPTPLTPQQLDVLDGPAESDESSDDDASTGGDGDTDADADADADAMLPPDTDNDTAVPPESAESVIAIEDPTF